MMMVVLAAEDVDRVGFVLLAREQRLDIREDGLLLVGHVAVDLGDVLVEVAQDGERDVAQAAIDRLDQFAADGRQAEAEEVAMRIVQVVRQSTDRDPLGELGAVAEVHQHVHHREERRRIDAVLFAHLGDRPVAEPERDAEAAHHLQDRVAVAHQVAHSVFSRITSRLVHSSFCRRIPGTAVFNHLLRPDRRPIPANGITRSGGQSSSFLLIFAAQR